MSGRVRVVIVDDHEAVRGGVAAILSADEGIEVVGEAENGFDALALCVRTDPDVALVDLRMPGTDGIWATGRITAESRTRVLVLTTFDSDDLISAALSAGARGYLLKTARGPELIRAVHDVAQERHVLDPAVAGTVIASYTRRPAPEPRREFDLTGRERDVLRLVAEGHGNQAIADELGVSVTTVKTHIASLYAKTGAASRVELARLAGG